MADRKKILNIAITAAILAVVYILLMTVAPGLSIWSSCSTFDNSKDAVKTEIKAGDTYTRNFVMPFDTVRSVDINLSGNGSSSVVKVDAVMTLADEAGNVIATKNITSAYDAVMDTGRLNVSRESTYQLTITVNSVGTDVKSGITPVVLFNPDSGKIIFEVYGTGSGASAKLVFAGIYVLFSAMVMLYVYNLDKKGIKDCLVCDRLVIGVIMVSAVLMICQYYDLFMIIKSALRMFDSFKAGNFTDYYGYSYLSELEEQSSKMLFAYEYNFFQIFFVGILIFPLTFFMDGNLYGGGMEGLFAVMYLSVMLAVLVIVAYKLVGRILKSCGLSEEQTMCSKLVFITSPMLLYISIGYGQIDIMYMIVIICALPFYYSKKYLIFSAVMSLAVAMKTIPLIIFFPLLLLAVKKVKDILINTVIVFVLPAFTHLVFEGSASHQAISRLIKKDYSYVDRLTEIRIGDVASLFIVAFVVICIVCYFTKTDADDKVRMLYRSQLAIAAVYGAFIIFVNWHLQWMIPLVLAVSILVPLIRDNRDILIMDIAVEALFIGTACFMGTSTHQVNFGILPIITNEYSDASEMTGIMRNISSVTTIAVRSCLAASLIVMLFMLYRKRNEITSGEDNKGCVADRRYVVGRTGILYLLILFFCWTFFYIG